MTPHLLVACVGALRFSLHEKLADTLSSSEENPKRWSPRSMESDTALVGWRSRSWVARGIDLVNDSH